MKLDVTLVGNYFAVGLLHLTRPMIKAGMQAFGSRKWADILNGISYDREAAKLQEAVKTAIGKRIEVKYAAGGVRLDDQFGMEVFVDNEEYPYEHVDGKSSLLRIEKFMTGYHRKDMLCECKASGIGSLICRWRDVGTFDESKIRLEYDDLRQVMDYSEPFEVVTMVTYDGKKPDILKRDGGDGLTFEKAVYRIP